MYLESKKVIVSCLNKNQDNLPGYSSLSSSLLSHLRQLVGCSIWKEAEMYFVKYLHDVDGMSVSQAEETKLQVAIQAALAYRDLRLREHKKRRAITSDSCDFQDEEQKRERKKQRCSRILPTQSSSSLQRQRTVKIKFDKVTVREYDLTAGDNPSCSSGVPITLSWKYNPIVQEIPIDEYEKCYAKRGDAVLLSANDRYAILAKHGVPNSEIIEAQEECQRIRKERQETVNSLLQKIRVINHK